MKKTFLIIDDDEDFLELEKIYINSYTENKKIESKIFSLTDAADADDLLYSEENEPDVILLDAFMPNKNGWELIDEIKEKKPSLLAKTVLITGIVEEVSTARKNEIKVLVKPISKELLFQTLDSIITF